MARELLGRDRNGRLTRFIVDDAAEAVLRREGREQLMEFADRVDPEPDHERVTARMKRDGSTYELAAEAEFLEWGERRQKREVDLSAGDEATTTLSGDDAHHAIVAELSQRGLGSDRYGAVAAELAASGKISN